MRSEEDIFTHHLAMLFSEDDVSILVEGIANAVVVVIVVVVATEVIHVTNETATIDV